MAQDGNPKMKNLLKNNWPKISAFLFAVLLLLWAAGCPATVSSPLNSNNQLTRAELQIELDMLLNTYQHKLSTLDQEERLRKLILQNALVIARAGSVEPLSILTTLLGFYGAGSIAASTGKAVKKKLKK